MTVTEPASTTSSDPGRRAYPGPSPLAVPGLLRKLWFDRLAMLTDAASEFGDVVKFAMGPKTLTSSTTPITPSTSWRTTRPTITRA